MCAAILPAHAPAELASQLVGFHIHCFSPLSKSSHRGTSVALSGSTSGRTSTRGFDVAKEDRGFASMDRTRQKEIASKGGKAAHQKGTAHEWTSEEARDAGRKGGLASHRRRREQKDSGETREMVGAGSSGYSGPTE